MDPWFVENLVCPRDHSSLQWTGNALLCEKKHAYPVVNGIPVMLLNEVMPTNLQTTESLERAAVQEAPQDGGQAEDAPVVEQNRIDEHVQSVIAATSGYLYEPLLGKLTRYPIPRFRLPAGSGKLLLDVGCNWGRWCIAAERKGYHAVGIDTSLDAVEAARRVNRQIGAGARFLVADARYLPFRAGSFDVVFSYSVIQHFDKRNARLALAEAARTLKIHGAAVIQMPNAYGIRSLYHQIRRGFREGQDFDVRYWRPGELRRAFAEIIGDTALFVDGYFGLGIQASDSDLLPWRYRLIVQSSEILRRWSRRMPWLVNVADSIYVRAERRPLGAGGK